MTKKKAPAKKVYERPLAFPVYTYVPLDIKEREKLRGIISDPVFQKAIRNAHAKKPSVNPTGTGISANPQCEQIANNRLHQLQGWEMLEAAIFAQAEEAAPRTFVPLKETYPTENQ
jgi:hypothetical protein